MNIRIIHPYNSTESCILFDDTTTLGEVSACLIGCNASLRYGDKISILYLMQVRPQREINFYMPHAELKLYEFVLEGDSRIPFYTLVDERLFRVKEGCVCTDERVGEGAVGYVHSRKTKRCTEYSTQSLVLLPGTVLCRTYGSPEKSYESAASYGGKVENGKLKVESEKSKRDKATVTKEIACINEGMGASDTVCAIETAGRGIAKEQGKAEPIRKLNVKGKKGKRKIKRNKKVSKNGRGKEKRIRGNP
jgi:hypothetical protein